MRFVIAYAVTGLVFLGLDLLWLTQIALGIYRRQLGSMLLERPNMAVACLFYLVFVAGVVILVVLPADRRGDWTAAVWGGAVFGLAAYSTYDLTNMATLRNWSLVVTAADLVWGTVVTATASSAGAAALGLLTRLGVAPDGIGRLG